MKKILTILAAICAIACTNRMTTVYDFSAETNKGEELNFSQYKGKVLMIVNTASNPDIKWNFTKFLIDRKGRVAARFEPVVTPEQLKPEIEALL